MKYSDCPSITATIQIEGSADAVWAQIADLDLSSRNSSELESVEWLDGATEGAVGARIGGVNSNPIAGTWKTTSVVTAWEPNQAFEWAVGDPSHPVSKWRFTITPVPDTKARTVALEQWYQIGPGESNLTKIIAARPDKEDKILRSRLRSQQTNMQANLDAVKAAVESQG